jgi:hypothetical protein
MHRIPRAANTTMYPPHVSRRSESLVFQADRFRTAAKRVITTPTGDRREIDSHALPSVPL